MTWTVTGSRHLHRDRWLSVRADDCVTQSGAIVAPFYVLEYPDWVHVVALDRADHVLLVRQYRHGLGGMSLELPGGMMDKADADPVAAGMRELAEETGYAGDDRRLIASLSPNPATHANRLHVVLAQNVEPRRETSLDETEDVFCERVPCAEAVRLALEGGIMHAAHAGLLLMALKAAGRLALSLVPAKPRNEGGDVENEGGDVESVQTQARTI